LAEPAVFLDRDGVLNRALVRDGRPFAPSRLAQVELLPGVVGACAELRRAGYVLVIVTNQPELARGGLDPAELDAMNEAIAAACGIEHVRVCPHDDADGCHCRKPLPGLLRDAARQLDLDLSTSWMVGDRWRDVAAGHAAGVRCIFVDHGWDERRPDEPFTTVADLAAAAALVRDGRGPKDTSQTFS